MHYVETGHPKESISREFLSKELNFTYEAETENLFVTFSAIKINNKLLLILFCSPILYKIVSLLVNRDKDHKATDNLQDHLKLEHDPDLVIIVDNNK